MVKFIHLSDTHLGYRQYKIEEREKDFEKALERAVKEIIKKKVDFVIHSGDFFNDGNPKVQTLVFSIELLKKVREKGIKFFAIPGNHDYRVDENILTVLEKVGLLINLASRERYEKLGNLFINKGFKLDIEGVKIFLAGLPGVRAKIEELYKKQRFRGLDEFEFKIFCFHHTLIEIDEKEGDISYSLLPKGFNYYAGGHWHIKAVLKEKKVFYPGSLEVYDVREIENSKKDFSIIKNKYIFLYDLDKGLEEIEIEIRPFIFLKYYSKNYSSKKIQEDLIKIIKEIETKNSPLLYIKVFGNISGSKLEINKYLLEEIAKSRGFLSLRLNLDYLESKEDIKVRNIKEKSVLEIEREFLEEWGFSKREVEGIIEIIDLIGKEYSNDIERRAAIHKTIKIIKDIFEIED